MNERDRKIETDRHVVWTETSATCACGIHFEMGSKTLLGVRAKDAPKDQLSPIVVASRSEAANVVQALLLVAPSEEAIAVAAAVDELLPLVGRYDREGRRSK